MQPKLIPHENCVSPTMLECYVLCQQEQAKRQQDIRYNIEEISKGIPRMVSLRKVDLHSFSIL